MVWTDAHLRYIFLLFYFFDWVQVELLQYSCLAVKLGWKETTWPRLSSPSISSKVCSNSLFLSGESVCISYSWQAEDKHSPHPRVRGRQKLQSGVWIEADCHQLQTRPPKFRILLEFFSSPVAILASTAAEQESVHAQPYLHDTAVGNTNVSWELVKPLNSFLIGQAQSDRQKEVKVCEHGWSRDLFGSAVCCTVGLMSRRQLEWMLGWNVTNIQAITETFSG